MTLHLAFPYLPLRTSTFVAIVEHLEDMCVEPSITACTTGTMATPSLPMPCVYMPLALGGLPTLSYSLGDSQDDDPPKDLCASQEVIVAPQVGVAPFPLRAARPLCLAL